MNQLATTTPGQNSVTSAQSNEQVFVTIYVAKQLFGIPVERVQDILIPQNIAHIPLAPNEIAGAINLRGRIVTVVDVRQCLGLEQPEEGQPPMCVTVEQGLELYSLKVDSVGAVISMPIHRIEKNPTTLDQRWRRISSGVIQLEEELLILLEIDSLLGFTNI